MARTATRTKPATPDQSAAIAALEARLSSLEAENKELRRVAPVARTKMIDSGDLQIGPGDRDVHMDATGAAELQMPTIDMQTRPLHKDKAEALAFMEELVVVRLGQSSDPKEGLGVIVHNDGKPQLFIRGRDITCRRKHLEVLARAKPKNYDNVEFIDEDGVRKIKWPEHTGQRFSFQVTRDDNPRGAEWLRDVLMQP